jgi:hypothetical protein
LGHQGKEGPQSGSVGWGGVELDSGGKQCCLIKALKALSLAFSRLSSSISFSISLVRCSVRCERCLICSISISIPRTGRQLRVDKNDRHRGSDEGDAPLLLDADGAAGEVDVVIGGKQGDQTKDQAAAGLDGTEVIEAGPGAQWCRQFWRNWWCLAVGVGAWSAWSVRGHRGREATESPGASPYQFHHRQHRFTAASPNANPIQRRIADPEGQHHPEPLSV